MKYIIGDTKDSPLFLGLVGMTGAAAMYIAGYIFSESVKMSIFFAAAMVPAVLKEFIAWRRKNIVLRLERQFAEIMQIVLSSVSAGMSVEQAFVELNEGNLKERPELKLIMKEVEIINRKLIINYSFYDAFKNFAMRSGSSDIKNFSAAVAVSGTRGGNIVYIIRNSLANMRMRFDTDREIRHTLALPKYNHRIITAMPFLLILMIKSISYEYMQVIYQTREGKLVSLCVAAVLLTAWIIGSRLCNIDM